MSATPPTVRSPRRPAPKAPRRVKAPPPVEKDGYEKIVAVAIRSFSELGYEGTTTAGIAREAGVTQPLVHHHFGSKEGLWRAAMAELFAPIQTFAVASDAAPAERLLQAFEDFVRFVAVRPEVTRVIAREGATRSPRLTYLVDTYLREAFATTVQTIRSLQKAGLVARDLRPELILFLFLGAGSHLFDVAGLAEETLGIDAAAAGTREAFVALVREVLRRGVFTTAAATSARSAAASTPSGRGT